MVTIILAVSREAYLEKVITSLELLECNPRETNILCIVDGTPELYVKVRNLIMTTKFQNRLTVQFEGVGKPSRYDKKERRKRIAAIHNQARQLLVQNTDFVFSVEDDTTFGPRALKRLLKIAQENRAFGMAEGVEVGRWGTPYIGAWVADDIYKPTLLTSVENRVGENFEGKDKYDPIDAGGLYCALIRTDLYKQHEFTCDNGLGPDVNLGLEMRQLGFQNFIAWNVLCTHHTEVMGKYLQLTPTDPTKIVRLKKFNSQKWTSHT